MTRPVGRSPARYGLPDTPRVREDLQLAGLFADSTAAGPAGPVEDAAEVLSAVSRSGRPDLAVTGLARLMQAAPQDAAEIGRALRTRPRFRGRLLGVLGGSAGLSDHLVANPPDWRLLLTEQEPGGELLDPAAVTRLFGAAVGISAEAPPCTGSDGGRATVTGGAAMVALRRAYRSQLLIIAAHDLAPAVEPSLPAVALPAVCRSLTALADAMLQCGLAVAAAELPASAAPASLAVIAMGKTGARELNYLSDVDVIFVADHPDRVPEEDRNETRMLATATALASGMMRICGLAAWEVDAALRPEGKAGALVRTPASHAAYYARWAHTWEFQALLKARPAAGDPVLGAKFMDITRPGVWSAAGRESFVDDVQAMRRRVEDNIPEGLRDSELKLGAGGLRDVEFAVQLLQLVHGRTDEELRIGGTLSALRALVRGGYVGRADGAELASAYTFLRRVEHRLQLQRLRRTHLLPTDDADLEWLARTEGYWPSGASSAAEAFTADRTKHATTVRRLHEKLFYRPLLHAVAAVSGDELRLSPQAAVARLAALGFANADAALRHLTALTSGVTRAAAIQRTLLPVMLDTFSSSPDPDSGLLSYRQVSEALADTPWYLRLLRDEGLVAGRLAGLLGGSKLVGNLLTRAPEVLRLLTSDPDLVAETPEQVRGALLARSRRSSGQEAVNAARSARRHEMLRIACVDLLGLRPLEWVTTALTNLTEAVVAAALDAATRQITDDPICRLTVIGMGRLGGAEVGYGSDADVMYVAEPLPGQDLAAALDQAVAIADLLARMLAKPSPDPALPVDADLRPEGRNGRLVRTLDAFRAYWARFAAPWERQALLRARPIAGDRELGERFVAAADEFRYPDGGLSLHDTQEIRRIKARVDAERLPRGADPTTHTKLGRGGLADIEWTVQLLQLRYAFQAPGLRTTRTLAALDGATAAGLLEEADAEALREGWRSASRARNALMLVRGKADDQLPAHGRDLAGVARALGYPAGDDPGEFIDHYRRAARRARRSVDRLFDAS